MKSLQESLFDNDLVSKKVTIDFDMLKDMFFYFGRSRASFFDKNEMIYKEYPKSFRVGYNFNINERGRENQSCFKIALDFEITNTKTKSGILTPRLVVHRLLNPVGEVSNKTVSDRLFDQKIKNYGLNISKKNGVIIADENITKIFDIFDEILKIFVSSKFKIELKELAEKYINNPNNPNKELIGPSVLNELMKKLII